MGVESGTSERSLPLLLTPQHFNGLIYGDLCNTLWEYAWGNPSLPREVASTRINYGGTFGVKATRVVSTRKLNAYFYTGLLEIDQYKQSLTYEGLPETVVGKNGQVLRWSLINSINLEEPDGLVMHIRRRVLEAPNSYSPYSQVSDMAMKVKHGASFTVPEQGFVRKTAHELLAFHGYLMRGMKKADAVEPLFHAA